jgi:hypothetical protein
MELRPGSCDHPPVVPRSRGFFLSRLIGRIRVMRHELRSSLNALKLISRAWFAR